MEKRICPECSKPAYSSSFSHDWNCPYCGKGVSAKPNCGEVEECSLYEHCEGCTANEDEGREQNAEKTQKVHTPELTKN